MYNYDYDFLRQINLHQNFKIVTDVWNGESRELLSHKYCKGTLTSLLQNQSMENFYENRYIWIWVIWKCTISRKDYWFHLRTEKANFKSVPGLNLLQAFFTYNSFSYVHISKLEISTQNVRWNVHQRVLQILMNQNKKGPNKTTTYFGIPLYLAHNSSPTFPGNLKLLWQSNRAESQNLCSLLFRVPPFIWLLSEMVKATKHCLLCPLLHSLYLIIVTKIS